MTQAGETCPTKSEDVFAAAFAQSEAWQELTEKDSIEDEEERIAAAGVGQHIFFNSLPLPNDGHCFTLGDLQERRVAMLILQSPEEGAEITPGEAQGVIYESWNIDMVFERWIRDSELSDSEVDRNRELFDKVYAAAMEAAEYILLTKGPRYLAQPITVLPPVMNDYKEEKPMGRWQQMTVKAKVGGAPTGD